MKIRAIEVEAFRGFCERQRFEFADADVLLLYGPNGHGKTSFFDAIEWALTGQIARFEEAREKKQQATPYYQNLFAQERPLVMVEFDGMTVVRTAHEVSKQQEITLAVHIGEETLRGDEAEAFLQERLVNGNWRGIVTPGHGLGLTHFLSQERMDRFVRGIRGDERYHAISLLFGTEAFLRYKAMFREAQKALEQEISVTEARLVEAQKTVATYRDTRTLPKEEIESAMRTLQAFGAENGLPIEHILSLLDLLNVSDHSESIRDKLAEAEDHVRALTALRDRLQADLLIAKEIIQAVPVAVEDLYEQVMAQLFDTIQMVFARINSHPLFRRLDLTTNKSYGSYRLLLSVLTGEHEADPSFIFSSAQINSIALAVFLAMAMQQRWSPLQVIGMDDPVQSMDELNVLALIDLIRLLCDSDSFDKQVIISTHDASFYRMMQRKFRFLRVRAIEYEGYGKRGPIIKQMPPVPPLSMPELAPKLLELQ